MLRIYQSRNQSNAKDYYTAALAQEDYYTADREIVGRWRGAGATYLNLGELVDRDTFAALCENRHPTTGGKLTPRTRDDRTVGYDCNFHAPKSISVIHALTGDERIVEAMRWSVDQAMLELERSTQTRVRLGGKSEDRLTGNLAWGEFVHFTARPVEGVADPHLHVHAFAFNATFDQTEQRWKAAKFKEAVRDAPYFAAVFHARLAGRLADLGYTIERIGDRWELAGVPRTVIEKFSNRTKEIEAEAQRRGITDPTRKSELGARTRKAKDTYLTVEDQRGMWWHRLTSEEQEALHRVSQGPDLKGHGLDDPLREQASPERITAKQALDYAIAHTFQTTSVECSRRLMATALNYGVGHVSPEAIADELSRRAEPPG